MAEQPQYNISESKSSNFGAAIIGGGLSGLSLSILLAKAGHNVILFEKEKYPFHKVCGEYISIESWKFVEKLGVPLSKLNLPLIKNLIVSSPNGKYLKSKLDLGGFGISRYFLDHYLKEVALQNGVQIYEGCKVNAVSFAHDLFTVKYNRGEIKSRLAVGSFGK